MGHKVSLLIGLGVGYVLGARAGRRRYEQIKSSVNNFLGQPWVKQSVDTVQDFAKEQFNQATSAVTKVISETTAKNATAAKATRTAKSTAKTAVKKTTTAAKKVADAVAKGSD